MSNATLTTSAELLREAMPDEVVTQAMLRQVELPGGAGRLALITLDNGRDHTRPSTFGPAGLTSLEAALREAEQLAAEGAVRAVAITGKPFIFAVGADLGMVSAGATREHALALARRGHEVFGRLGELGVPSFAYVNGAAMGGGLEAALNCTYRTVSSGVPAIALPECFLGLVPGWGGSYLLPNLIGPERALKVIIANPMANNRMLTGRQAYDLGIADAIFDPADFLEESLRWTAQVLSGERPDPAADRAPIDRSEAAWQQAIDAARAVADAKVNGAAPAPYRALELVALARTADRATAFAAEDEALADLIMGDELRASMYAYQLVNKRARRPVGVPQLAAPRPITSVGIVGAGLMASQLALLFARRLQVPVVMTDLDQARVDQGVAWVHSEIDTLQGKGRITPDTANRLKALVGGTTGTGALAGADLVIEAVYEDLAVKRQVLAEVEAVVSDTCVLMTNTSSLPIGRMAEALAHPERLVGFHFFNPVAVMPLVEVVRAEATDDETVATAFALGRQLKKSCVLVKDAPAFVVNRLLIRFIGEVTRAFDEGTPLPVADRALAPLGLPMTPFTLLGLVGPAVALHVSQILHESLGERYHVSPNLQRLVEAGKTSLWSQGPDGAPRIDPEAAALLRQGDSPSSEEQVRQRALTALAEEIQLMLEEGVVSDVQDIDLCMILGAGWPFHLGGITPYLDRAGVSERVAGRRFLPPGVASLPG